MAALSARRPHTSKVTKCGCRTRRGDRAPLRSAAPVRVLADGRTVAATPACQAPGTRGPPFPRPPGRCQILPGKLAVQGLPEAKRRAAKAADRRALDRELSRRQHARRGRTARRLLRARSLGSCVTAGGRAGGGCEATALRQRPAPCVPTLRQRARLPSPRRRDPPTSATYGAGPPESSSAAPQVSPRPPHEPAWAGRPGAPKACP